MIQIRNLAAVCLALSGLLRAQTPSPGDPDSLRLLTQQIKALEQQTSELRERVKTLEAERANVPAAAPRNPQRKRFSPLLPMQKQLPPSPHPNWLPPCMTCTASSGAVSEK
jgi:hypothetical protein